MTPADIENLRLTFEGQNTVLAHNIVRDCEIAITPSKTWLEEECRCEAITRCEDYIRRYQTNALRKAYGPLECTYLTRNK